MRELRVEDALLYLDQVKMEFGDRPHIYNEFLDIMKTFKTQQLDTPGVIRRVSSLFQGNKRLVLGFNTFLPEGYKIELGDDGNGPPVAVYRAPGQSGVTQILGPAAGPATTPQPPSGQSMGPPNGSPATQAHPMISQQQAKMMAVTRPAVHPQQMQPPHHTPQDMTQRTGQPVQQASAMSVDQSAGGPFQQQMAQKPPQHAQPQSMQIQQSPTHVHAPPQQRPAQQQQMMEPKVRSNGHVGAEQGMLMAQAASSGGGVTQPQPAGPDGKISTATQGPMTTQGSGAMQQQGGFPHGTAAHQAQVREPPVEFDHAINYVTTIKKRFAAEPETYKKFLEILHTYQKEQRGIKEVLDEVSLLFADHPDLLKQFTYFLPDAVQAQAKAQLDQVAKEAESRKRAASSKQAIMQTAQGMQRQAMARGQPIGAGGVVPTRTFSTQVTVPFGATQGRSDEREREICRSAIYGSISFSPVRPPRRDELSPAQAAIKNGRPQMIPEIPVQPSTAEAAFFERAKLHLSRRELAPDKPAATRRHTPYTEFLKCLHLFGAGILNKEELLLLLRSLFMQGHAPKSGINAGGGASNPAVASDAQELLKEFEEILVGRGPYADQENSRKDKSKYGALSLRDFDFSECETPTPSYRTFPSDFPEKLFFSHAGRTEADASVLNDTLVCIGPESPPRKRAMWSLENYDGVRVRRNAHEEAMFKVEDERFEVDMAIERNVVAMRQVEPMADEVTHLRENEEKDGQPIGRMQYTLRSRALNCTQINAIARVYGERGDEVLQHLMRNPVAALPIVYQRLRQKDAEWRKVKTEQSRRWNSIYLQNYEGSLDVLCFSYKKELESSFSVNRLLEDCKRTHHFMKHPRKNMDHPATLPFKVELAMSYPVPEALLFQPHVRFSISNDMPHRDAIHLVATKLVSGLAKSGAIRERASRIWAEVMAPWFGYSPYWILDELRKGYGGDENSVTVKFSPGQKVLTPYGVGTIYSRIAATKGMGLRYKVKLPFGTGFIRPSSMIHAIPANDTASRRIRRDGVMEPAVLSEGGPSDAVDDRYQIMFSTENGYIFMRSYCLLTSILSNTLVFLRENQSRLDNERKNKTVRYAVSMDVDPPEGEETIPPYDYGGILFCLRKHLLGGMDASSYENFCRKTTRDKVYQLVALPKLIEQCAGMLVKLSSDDTFLTLSDLSRLRIMSPERLRRLSQAETKDSFYRIQYDSEDESIFFCYLSPGEEVLLSPPEEAMADTTAAEDEEEDEDDEADATMDEDEMVENADGDDQVDVMHAETERAFAEEEEDETDEPTAKRQKL